LDNDGNIVPEPGTDQVTFHDHGSPSATGGSIPAFPRAMLGLPIIFHFADAPNQASRKAGIPEVEMDPDDSTLLPLVDRGKECKEKASRMTSPVITKALRLRDGWHAALIILRTPEIDGLEAQLVEKSSGKTTQIAAGQIAGPAVSGFKPMAGEENALDALVSFLEREGFTRYGS
jgi:hypothetical protein